MIPRAWMGSESIAHEAEGQIGYWLRGRESERNNNYSSHNNYCCSKFQLVGQKYWEKTTLANKTRFSRHCFGFQSWCFSLLVGELLVKSSGLCLFVSRQVQKIKVQNALSCSLAVLAKIWGSSLVNSSSWNMWNFLPLCIALPEQRNLVTPRLFSF